MIKKMVLALVIAGLGIGGVFGLGLNIGQESVYAANAFNEKACGQVTDDGNVLDCKNEKTVPQVATEIFQIVISLLGIVAVLMIVVAGQRYITSNGEPEKIKQARNMIMYSLIGLIIAILAFAIVTFVQHSISQ